MALLLSLEGQLKDGLKKAWVKRMTLLRMLRLPSPAQAALQANDNDNILVNMFRALELKLEMAESLRKN